MVGPASGSASGAGPLQPPRGFEGSLCRAMNARRAGTGVRGRCAAQTVIAATCSEVLTPLTRCQKAVRAARGSCR